MTTDQQERDDNIISFQKWVGPDVYWGFIKPAEIRKIHCNKMISRVNPVLRYYSIHHIVVTHTK